MEQLGLSVAGATVYSRQREFLQSLMLISHYYRTHTHIQQTLLLWPVAVLWAIVYRPQSDVVRNAATTERAASEANGRDGRHCQRATRCERTCIWMHSRLRCSARRPCRVPVSRSICSLPASDFWPRAIDLSAGRPERRTSGRGSV